MTNSALTFTFQPVTKNQISKLINLLIKHSHKKRKDSMERSLDRALFAAEFEFPKILVPRLPQNPSNVNTE